MSDQQPPIIHLKNYCAPDYQILTAYLHFDLYEECTWVHSRLQMKRAGEHQRPLILHGQEMQLIALAMNGQKLAEEDYVCTADSLTLIKTAAEFELSCSVKIDPQTNTSLEGLFKSRGMFCTQCEAEGFRKITYFLDRPDVLAVFTTRISADRHKYPVLLSNGNCIARGESAGDRHWTEWLDPYPKPSYLFALIAGNLARLDDHFVTCSGRKVDIQFFVEAKDLDKCTHAISALKNAMKWDEQVYGREYDLDVYMVVAVDDFNTGAMENKGLNIFNTACVLAHPDTTTDIAIQQVESVVAHEYFHNWSGNRVTCRDWFQLSLKEGFTVFRDAEFSADHGSRTVKRVEAVQLLRTAQFTEDSGPMAHPVQPASFIEISNFYTLTIYEKGAEVVRMLHTLLGPTLFRRATDLYFQRHDGEAVTINDFVQAMEDVSGRDLNQFMHWYRQAGTPQVSITDHYDSAAKKYSLTFKQTCPSTPEAKSSEKLPFHIPVAMGLLGGDGPLYIFVVGETNFQNHTVHAGQQAQAPRHRHCVLELTRAEQTFVFGQITEKPVPSLFRGFSAPVKIQFNYSTDDLLRIMTLDDDGFCRWNACQELGLAAMNTFADDSSVDALLRGYGLLLDDESCEPAMVALMLTLPTEAYLAGHQSTIDVEGNYRARLHLIRRVAQTLRPTLERTYQRCHRQLNSRGQDVSAEAIGLRSLQNVALDYLMNLDGDPYLDLCWHQFIQGENMTDVFAALTSLVCAASPASLQIQEQALTQFYRRWQAEPLVVNNWFAVQASSPQLGTLAKIQELLQHPAFDFQNPNKLRSVIGVFSNQNLIQFHSRDGLGYAFLAEQILILNNQNPQVAARLMAPLTQWQRYDAARQQQMKSQLENIIQSDNLSRDVYEVASRSLMEA